MDQLRILCASVLLTLISILQVVSGVKSTESFVSREVLRRKRYFEGYHQYNSTFSYHNSV